MPGGAAAPQPAAWHLCLLALHRSTAGQACTCRMGACASPPGGGKGLHSGAARSAAPKPMQHACQPARRTHRRLRGPPPEVDAAPASSRAGTALSAGAPSAGVLGSPPAVSSSVQPRPSSTAACACAPPGAGGGAAPRSAAPVRPPLQPPSSPDMDASTAAHTPLLRATGLRRAGRPRRAVAPKQERTSMLGGVMRWRFMSRSLCMQWNSRA